jgi:hypothetical protein
MRATGGIVEVFVLRRSELKRAGLEWPVYMWVCPVCGRRVASHSRHGALLGAVEHLARKHGFRVVVE